ncbi:DUF1080 domain-containing protein [uncultured Cyclobacterium sp.]|uniref:3-keto-disaccharide hydrolase n=1 Tax=uncultured Cyclobacterium sp. TaxID=453820 RepID=UPI0030EDB3E2
MSFRFFGSLVVFLIVIVLNACKQDNLQEEVYLFNGNDLSNWSSSDMSYWSVSDSSIVGGEGKDTIVRNQFIWHKEEVKDFYLKVLVKMVPNTTNAGIQFRSQKKGEEALGYQADIGQGVWGRLYHESGREKLHWEGKGEEAVKKNDWNTYEILAVGNNIWTAINGTLSVAYQEPDGELEGFIALQVHAGPSQIVKYKSIKLIHNPELRIGEYNESELMEALVKSNGSPYMGGIGKPFYLSFKKE